MKSCKIEGLAACLEEEILKPYAAYCAEGMEAGITKTMKQMVKETKATAPRNKNPRGGRRSGKFASAITHTGEKMGAAGFKETWHVRSPEYPLTHLLTNGHALRQGGRAKGNAFLENAVAKADAQLIENIINELK